MPLRRKIPNLKHLCIENIARMIIRHGEHYKRYENNEDVCVPYKIFQSLFTDELLERLFKIFRDETFHEDESFMKLRSLFVNNSLGSLADWPCVKLMFNEYTTSVPNIERPFRYVVPKEIPYIASQCQNLCDIDLGCLETSDALEKILHSCIFIRKLSADMNRKLDDHYQRTGISDAFLLSLCKYRSKGEEFVFCPEDGACSSAGKHLRSLRMMLSKTTGAGIACALQHLPQLQDFVKLPFHDTVDAMFDGVPDVVKGIMILQNAAVSNGKLPLIFKLTDYLFERRLDPDELCTLSFCCPQLTTIQIDLDQACFNPQIFTLKFWQNIQNLHLMFGTNEALSFAEFLQFLLMNGQKIKVLSFIDTERVFCVNYRHFTRILEACCNLKELNFWFIGQEDDSDNVEYPLLSCINKLEKISVSVELRISLQSKRYFSEIFCMARNVKCLDISLPYANAEIARVIETNPLASLEFLCIRSAFLNEIPLEKLINANNALRRMEFRNCKFEKPTLARCKEIARTNNYELEITNYLHYYRYED